MAQLKGILPQSFESILEAINTRMRDEVEQFTSEEALGILWQLKDEFPITVGES